MKFFVDDDGVVIDSQGGILALVIDSDDFFLNTNGGANESFFVAFGVFDFFQFFGNLFLDGLADFLDVSI